MRPEFLSVSQLSVYLQCPRKYRFRYLDGRDPEDRPVALALGAAVHATLAWWLQERIAGRTPSPEDVLRTYRADWLSERVATRLLLRGESPAQVEAAGEALVRLFVDRFAEEPPPRVAEERFEVELVHPATGQHLPVRLVGFVDFATDRLVGEIKTTSRRMPPSQWWFQLAAYRYAHRRRYGTAPRLVLVELIKAREPKLEVLDAPVTEGQERWFLEVASEVHRSIVAGAFHPIPSWRCATCEYRSACRKMK